jgi:hypothetical protein
MNICEDLRVAYDKTINKYDLDLDQIGRAQTYQDYRKLIAQIYLLFVNKNIRSAFLNRKDKATIISLAERQMSNFKDSQIALENENIDGLAGYNLFIYENGVYRKISDVPVEEYYEHVAPNGVYQQMGVGRVLAGAVSAENVDYTFQIRASQLTANQLWTIFPDFCAVPADRKIKFYFFSNRIFYGGSLLESIEEIQYLPVTDPRKVSLKIKAKSYDGGTVTLGIQGG